MISKHLISVPELRVIGALELLLAAASLAVLGLEVEGEQADDDEGETGSGDGGVDAGLVTGTSILGAEDEGANDTTDTTEPDEGGGTEGALPLATDVVSLVGEDGGNVAVGTGAL